MIQNELFLVLIRQYITEQHMASLWYLHTSSFLPAKYEYVQREVKNQLCTIAYVSNSLFLKKHLQYSIMQSFVLDTHNRLSSREKYISSLVFSVFTSNLFLFDIPFIYYYHDNMLRVIGYWNVCRWPFYYLG